MKPTMLALMLGLTTAIAVPGVASAQWSSKALQEAKDISIAQHRFETTLIVDALPLEAKVLVDGRDIGTASDLTGKAVSVPPGSHTVEISAPGFRPYVGGFFADTLSSVNQFRVVLAPE